MKMRDVIIAALLSAAAAGCAGADSSSAPSFEPDAAIATEATVMSEASEVPLETAPLETAPLDTAVVQTISGFEVVAGGDDCMCADGSDWNMWVREADPSKVVLFFQGGGACFTAQMCSFTDGSYDINITAADDPNEMDGIFNLTHPQNPLADYSFVFVPYCTGDVHFGDSTHDYGDGLVIEHNGMVNGRYALDEMIRRFPDATEVFVTGSSAGGVPSPLFAALAADELPSARVTALADGSGVYPDVPGVNVVIGSLWGAFDARPQWPELADIAAEDWSIPGLFTYAGQHNPEITFARFDNAYDEVQSMFASVAGVGADELVTLIDSNEAAIEASGIDVTSYVAPGGEHTVLGKDDLYTESVEGVALIDWLTQLVVGEPGGDVHCVECEKP